MTYTTIDWKVDTRGVGTLTLKRPEARNAICAELCREIEDVLGTAQNEDRLRIIVLTGEGAFFSAGADLVDFNRPSLVDRLSMARRTARWFTLLDRFPKPLLARVNGSAFGAGLGLISVCDHAIGTDAAEFSFSETRLGLTPNLIAPFVVRRLGYSNARSAMMSAEIFQGQRAVQLGLLHESVPLTELDGCIARKTEQFLQCAPLASAATKKLLEFVDHNSEEVVEDYTVEHAAQMWDKPEAIEGVQSFKARRQPAWRRT